MSIKKTPSKNILSHLDVFGVEISLKYENQKKFKSRLGGFITIIVVVVLLTLFYQQITQITNKENPNILYQQVHVDNPSRYDVTPKNYSLMVTLLKNGLTPWLDETFYTVQALFHEKIEEVQLDGSLKSVQHTYPLQIGPCGLEDFQFNQVKDYFQSIDYKNCYCIKDKRVLYLQGQFERKIFTDIQFKFFECTGQNCQPQPVIQAALKVAKAQIYFTNRILSLSNFEKPFTAVGKTIFYNIFYDFFVSTGFLFTNTFIVDDTGLFTQQKSQAKDLIFSQDRLQLASRNGALFFQCTFYLEKDREDQYRRNYKKLSDVISSLGGIFNVLFLLGSIFVKPYNNMQLQKSLYKEIFAKKKTNNQQLKQSSQLDQSKINQKSSQIDTGINNSIIQDPQKKESFKDKFVQLLQSYLRTFKCFKNDLTDILDLSQNKLDSYTNIKTIINTIIQFHKVETIVLGENTFLSYSPRKQNENKQQQQQLDLEKPIVNFQSIQKEFKLHKNISQMQQSINNTLFRMNRNPSTVKMITESNNEHKETYTLSTDHNILQMNQNIGREIDKTNKCQDSNRHNQTFNRQSNNNDSIYNQDLRDRYDLTENTSRLFYEQRQNSKSDIGDEPHIPFGQYSKRQAHFTKKIIDDNQYSK